MPNKKSLIILLLLILALLVVVHYIRRPQVEGVAEVGLQAPLFKLPDLQGSEVSLDQYRGKIVMLDFWATWCGPCRLTMPLLDSLQEEYADELALLAVNLQEPSNIVDDYIREQNISSTVLLDQDGKVGQLYQTYSIPMQVLIDKQGILRFIQLGYSPIMRDKLRAEINKLR